jgi:hypothetical protein
MCLVTATNIKIARETKSVLIRGIIPVFITYTFLEILSLTNFGFIVMNSLEFCPIIWKKLNDRLSNIENKFEWALHKYSKQPVQFKAKDITQYYP